MALVEDPSIDVRLKRLERANARLGVILAAAAIAALAWAAADPVGAQQMRTLEGEKLLIRTAEGKIGAVISIGNDGAPNLDLIDRNGTFRVRLGVGSNGATRLELADEDGKVIFKAP